MFDEGATLTQEEEDDFVRTVFRYNVYKVGSVQMGVCCCRCERSFKGKGVDDAIKFFNRLLIAITIAMFVQMCVSITESTLDTLYLLNHDVITAKGARDHLLEWGLPCGVLTALCSLALIYIL